jgi:hypothetical protein
VSVVPVYKAYICMYVFTRKEIWVDVSMVNVTSDGLISYVYPRRGGPGAFALPSLLLFACAELLPSHYLHE